MLYSPYLKRQTTFTPEAFFRSWKRPRYPVVPNLNWIAILEADVVATVERPAHRELYLLTIGPGPGMAPGGPSGKGRQHVVNLGMSNRAVADRNMVVSSAAVVAEGAVGAKPHSVRARYPISLGEGNIAVAVCESVSPTHFVFFWLGCSSIERCMRLHAPQDSNRGQGTTFSTDIVVTICYADIARNGGQPLRRLSLLLLLACEPMDSSGNPLEPVEVESPPPLVL